MGDRVQFRFPVLNSDILKIVFETRVNQTAPRLHFESSEF